MEVGRPGEGHGKRETVGNRQQSISVEEKPEREVEGNGVRELQLSELQHGRM